MLKRLRRLFARRGETSLEPAGTDDRHGSAAPEVHVGPKVVHRPIPTQDIDPDALKIVQRLTRFDHKAYLVGGCVRDLLLDRRPKDFDIGTSATPRQIKRLFRNCRIIGRRFRLAHIYFQNGKIIEVATFRARTDGTASDPEGDLLIRDDNLFGTPEEDALRRDFTINQLLYDVGSEAVLDHADGLQDLRQRLVRTIGDPEIRFREDPIRILRAIKFAARLDFDFEPTTRAALRAMRGEIPKAASPRILEEINRFCRGGAARRSFDLCRETGVFEVVLPEIAAAYRGREAAWRWLDAMFDAIDRRMASRKETSLGAIFAALILPALAPTLGWKDDGTIDPPKGLRLRDEIDTVLRPLALRLRLPRKDQEHCRQIVGVLFRSVPQRRRRRGSRRPPVGREALPDALWILEALGDLLGGELVEAAKQLRRSGAAEPAPSEDGARREASGDDESDERAPRRRRRSRRRRRGGEATQGDRPRDEEAGRPAAKTPGDGARRGGGGRRGGRARKPEDEPARGGDKAQRPARWDDDYFFSALPTVPEMAGDDGTDRYGASLVGPDAGSPRPAASASRDDADGDDVRDEAAADASSANGGSEDEAGTQRRRRRRRRRRRPRGGGGGSASVGADPGGGADGPTDDDDGNDS